MEKKLPVYKLVINDDDNDKSGVDYVAFVDAPAIDMKWMAFAEQRKQMFIGNEERRIVSGALMVAGMPIYRNDAMGEYYCIFDKETIFKIIQKYFRNGFTSNVNMMHDEQRKVDGVYMIESLFIDKTRGMIAPSGYGELADGSWFGSFKVDNDEMWNDFIKTGVFKGFSVEGIFEHKYLVDANEQSLQSLHEKLVTLRKKFESYTDYPQEASDNAKIALRYAEQYGWGDCGTPVGKIRANQLANRESISRETIARMAAFERHRQYSQKELGDGCGRLMWLSWGGDAGVEWASRKLKEIDKN